MFCVFCHLSSLLGSKQVQHLGPCYVCFACSTIWVSFWVPTKYSTWGVRESTISQVCFPDLANQIGVSLSGFPFVNNHILFYFVSFFGFPWVAHRIPRGRLNRDLYWLHTQLRASLKSHSTPRWRQSRLLRSLPL